MYSKITDQCEILFVFTVTNNIHVQQTVQGMAKVEQTKWGLRQMDGFSSANVNFTRLLYNLDLCKILLPFHWLCLTMNVASIIHVELATLTK